jgi:hypothetical protein
VQQRRLSKRQAEAGSMDSKQTLIHANAILTSFRSRFIAKSLPRMIVEFQARLGFLATKGGERSRMTGIPGDHYGRSITMVRAIWFTPSVAGSKLAPGA